MSGLVANGRSLPWMPSNEWRAGLILVLGLGFLMSFTGACNTGALPLWHRLSLWLVIAGLNVLQCLALARVLRGRWLPAAVTPVLAVLATILILTVELHYLKFTPLLPKAPDPPLAFLLFVAPIAGVVGSLALIFARLMARAPSGEHACDDDAAATSNVTQARSAPLQDWPDAPVLRVSAHDHYLDVYTPDGCVFLRGRMADAVRALAGKDGCRVHRSHWVALSQVVRVRRCGRDDRVVLRDGTELPVGRARSATLREALAAAEPRS